MILQVKVISGSSENSVVGFEENILKIKCRAVREKGKANQAVIEILANYYHVPKSSIVILKGKSSSRKVIKIEE